jgi:hypothetical protein
MKNLIWLLTITLFATTALAQKLAGQQAPPDVQIINYRFDHGFDRAKINNTDSDGRLVNRVSPSDDGPEDQYKATVLIKNNGAKRVKAITWGVVFVDLDTQKEVEHRKFYLKKGFGPGAERTLLRYVLPCNKPGTITVRAVIDRVEYDDGSVWQHP